MGLQRKGDEKGKVGVGVGGWDITVWGECLGSDYGCAARGAGRGGNTWRGGLRKLGHEDGERVGGVWYTKRGGRRNVLKSKLAGCRGGKGREEVFGVCSLKLKFDRKKGGAD